MTKLDYSNRPWVAFDAENKNHRRYFAEFQAKRTWGHCPVRFIVPDAHGDLLSLIQEKLLAHYLQKEFISQSAKALA